MTGKKPRLVEFRWRTINQGVTHTKGSDMMPDTYFNLSKAEIKAQAAEQRRQRAMDFALNHRRMMPPDTTATLIADAEKIDKWLAKGTVPKVKAAKRK